jgi:hypothetical protein
MEMLRKILKLFFSIATDHDINSKSQKYRGVLPTVPRISMKSVLNNWGGGQYNHTFWGKCMLVSLKWPDITGTITKFQINKLEFLKQFQLPIKLSIIVRPEKESVVVRCLFMNTSTD